MGEIVLFDRSWYNRAGVEHVMGFCTDEEYREFLRACPLFGEMLIKSGIILAKYWFSVNDEEQEVRHGLSRACLCLGMEVAELPSVGEIVLFDRSWYNRAGVEHVMGFCTDEEYREFLRACPLFEEMLIKSGIILAKYWFSVNDEEQEVRFQERMRNPIKRWKLSGMDVESRRHWVDYSRAKDAMFAETDTKISPWYVVNSDDKKKSRLNCIAHLLSKVPYRDLRPVEIELPPRQSDDYKRPKMSSQRFVPEIY